MLRLFSLLEHIAALDGAFGLQALVEATGWPKPTVHRMLQQLEQGGLVQREGEGRSYATGLRLRRFAQGLLGNSTLHAARHRVLRALVDEIGESCNLTALDGGEVVYLDRVETAAPLRFYLHPGSRVPAHASASGKVFLAQMPAAQRQRLIKAAPLERCTEKTLVSPKALEQELATVLREGHAFDREEFLPGLVCLAVPVPNGRPRASLCVALQAPVMRLPVAQAVRWLPALQRAAQALSQIEASLPADLPANLLAAPSTARKKPRR